jgi:hypothetical protein
MNSMFVMVIFWIRVGVRLLLYNYVYISLARVSWYQSTI